MRIVIKPLLYIVGIVLLVSGGTCIMASQPVKMSKAELVSMLNSPHGLYSTNFKGLFYCGCDTEYHYFRIIKVGHRDKKLKVPKTELALRHEMVLTSDAKKWIEMSTEIADLNK